MNRLTCLDIFQGLEYAKEPAVFLNKDYSVSFAHFLADTSKVQALKDCVGEPLEHAQRVVDSLVAVAQTRMVLVVGQLLLKKWFKWRVAAYGVVLRKVWPTKKTTTFFVIPSCQKKKPVPLQYRIIKVKKKDSCNYRAANLYCLDTFKTGKHACVDYKLTLGII